MSNQGFSPRSSTGDTRGALTERRQSRRRCGAILHRATAGVVITVALAVASSGCVGDQAMFDAHGPGARTIASTGWMLLGTLIGIYLAVMIALWFALRRRRSADDDSPERTAMLTRRVTAASITSAVILLGLMVASGVADVQLSAPPARAIYTIEAVGHRWWWDFRYRGAVPTDIVSSPNELHVPVGAAVVIELHSDDVIHSFWVPTLQGKRDMIPGHVSSIWLQADRAGVYRGQCAEFCGYQHAHMAFEVVAEPKAEFLAWVDRQRQPAARGAGMNMQPGEQAFLRHGCSACHSIRGLSAGATVGPDLTHVGARRTLAAGTLPNTRGHLAGWISNAQAIKPGSRMPPQSLPPADLEALLSYLQELR